jgi:hypothetical protein
MRWGFLGLTILLGLCGSACSNLTTLDDGIIGRIGSEELRRLQLYVSSDIELWRVLHSEETGVTARHSLRIDKGRRLEGVLIPAGTPGVLIKAEKAKLCVSFEPAIGGQEVFITFVRGNNGNKEGYFMYPDKTMNQGEMIVNYGGIEYTATPESRIAHLEVEQDKVKVSSNELREAPGRRVTDESSPK